MKKNTDKIEEFFRPLFENQITDVDFQATASEFIKNNPESREEIIRIIRIYQIIYKKNYLSSFYLPLTTLPADTFEPNSFTEDLLPKSIRRYIIDIVERYQVHIEFPLSALIVFLSAVIGTSRKISPRDQIPWLLTPNLWGVLIAKAGRMKSPIIGEVKSLLKLIEEDLLNETKNESHLSSVNYFKLETQKKNVQSKIDKLLKQSEASEGSLELRLYEEELLDIEKEIDANKPKKKRLIVNDVTIESLQVLMQDTDNGLLYYRDELIGLLRDLEKVGREGARAFLLEAWAGDSNFTIDRIGRGTTIINNCCLSIYGSIQPSVLEFYIFENNNSETKGDGLLERFQFAVYPGKPKKFKFINRRADEDAINSLRDAFFRIHKSKKNIEDYVEYRFSPEAQEFYNEYFVNHENRLNNLTPEEEPLESHLAKYRSFIPSLAINLQVLEDFTKEELPTNQRVNLNNLELAIKWGEILESHAVKIFNPPTSPGTAEAQRLAEKLLSGNLGTQFTRREFNRKNWRGLNNDLLNDAALEILVNHGWLRKEQKTETYHINPLIFAFGDQNESNCQ